MRPHSLSLIFGFALCSSALRVPLTKTKRSAVTFINGGAGGFHTGPSKLTNVLAAADGNDNTLDLNTVNDVIYIANVTIGENEYPVQLDTGSSDLWIKGPSFPIPNSSPTSTTYNLTYGIGYAFGNVSSAAVEFAGISIPQQAFLDISETVNPALQYGAVGILGLGFTTLSTIDSLVNRTGADWGRSLLYNAFMDNPEEPNFITFALQRSLEEDDEVEGAFTIGEVDPRYAAINDVSAIPTWPPVDPRRWNVLLDSFIVGTQTVPVNSTVPGVPPGKAVVLLDSGTSFTYCPPYVANAIYGGVPGARLDTTMSQWFVPCDAEIDMAVQINGQVYPIHPLDVSPKSVSAPNMCMGTFLPQTVAVGAGEFDWIVGDNILRSVYSLYDFGDFDSSGNMGAPYAKLLSIVDPNEASADFAQERGTTPRTNITYTPTDDGTNNAGGGSTTVSLSNKLAESLNKLVDFIPAMLGVLALNAIALLVVAGVGICYFIRRRQRKAAKKTRNALPLNSRAPTPYPGSVLNLGTNNAGSRDGDHEYQRVSVTAPEGEPQDEPFTPPAPAFHAYGGDTTRRNAGREPGVGPRPRSMFGRTLSTVSSLTPPVRDYRVSAAGSEMTAFVPPSPPFYSSSFDGKVERPKSVA